MFCHISCFICTIHIHFGAKICLYRIQNHKLCFFLQNCLLNSFIQHTKRYIRFVNHKNVIAVSLCLFKSRLYSISQAIFCRLVNNMQRLFRIHMFVQPLSLGKNCRNIQYECSFSLSGITLNDC